MACSIVAGPSSSPSLYNGDDVFVWLPTGHGKSLYNRDDVFMWLPTGYGKCLFYQAVTFLIDFKKGLVDTEKRSAVLVTTKPIGCIYDRSSEKPEEEGS